MIAISLIIMVFLVIRQLKKTCSQLVNPLAWHVLAWLFIILLYCSADIKWGTPLKADTVFYLSIVWLSLILGFRLGMRIDNKHRFQHGRVIMQEQYLDNIETKKYAVISICAGVIWGVSAIVNNELTFGIRAESYNQGIVSQLSLVVMGFSFFVWQYELLRSVKHDRKIPSYALLCLAVYILPNMIFAGRQCILVGGIATIITYLYGLKINRKYRYRYVAARLLAIAVALVVIYFSFITEVREGDVNRVAMYERIFNSKTSAEMLHFTKLFGPFEKIILQLVYYYGGILPGFEGLYKEYSGPVAMGAFQFQYISRRFPGYIGELNQLARLEMERFSDVLNMYMPIYRTYLRGYIIDFGRIGALFAVFFTGLVGGKSRKHYIKYTNDFNTVFQVMLCTAAVFAIEYSPLYDGNTWAYPFLCMFAVGVYERKKIRVTFGKKKRIRFVLRKNRS